MVEIFIILFFEIILMKQIHSYSTGPPNRDICHDMEPFHFAKSQTSKLPYNFTIDKQTVYQGDYVEMILNIGTYGKPFRGFLLTSKTYNSFFFGTFEISKKCKYETELYFCLDWGIEWANEIIGIHHASRVFKDEVIVKWKAPTNYAGNIAIVATVVETIEIFWASRVVAEITIIEKPTKNITEIN